jgi:hypothetical protein
MPNKKKTIKKHPKSKKAAGNKRRSIKKKQTAKKQLSKKKGSQKKVTMRSRASGKQTVAKKAASTTQRQTRKRTRTPGRAFSRETLGPQTGGQSGDLQGLSRREGADSESVEELLEEGNAFEADVVACVEDAGNADEKEVRTHEVPEDDVPGEYLDKE